MNLICLSLSHTTTPVALRERFAGPAAGSNDLLVARPDMAEYALLSTCNRLEVYAAQPEPDPAALLAFLEELSGLNRDDFVSLLVRYDGREVVRHLARVAAGLDSQVVGESQVLGQVAQAAETARERGVSGPVLEALFRQAVRAGKRARSETTIGRNPVSISSVAVRLAQEVLGDLSQTRVLVIGAGEMAELAIETLRERGVGPVSIINRTAKAAHQLADRLGARALEMQTLEQALAEADLVIASSGAPFVIVTPALLEHAAATARSTPLVFIDIAVPRNVSPEVTQLPNIHYFDIDDLRSSQQAGRAGREHAIPQVEAIIDQELEAFLEWERQQQVAPLIAGLRAKAEAIRQAEIERSLRRWPGAGPAERQRLEALTEAIVNRLLHQAITQLKAGAGEPQAERYASLLQELFALEESS